MRKILKSLPLAVLLATAALVPVACSKTPSVPGVTFDAGFALNQDAAPAPLYVPGDAGPADAAPSAVASGSAAPSGSASSAPPSASALALIVAGIDQALDIAIAGQAAKDAPGMTAEGQPGRATLQQGEHFGLVVTMQPGRCYTIIAMSAPLQVSELDVRLQTLGIVTEAGHSPATDKNPAILGRGKTPTCPISPIPLPYKVDVSARKGAGRVAVAVFSRSK